MYQRQFPIWVEMPARAGTRSASRQCRERGAEVDVERLAVDHQCRHGVDSNALRDRL
jgi:hypothetical protein